MAIMYADDTILLYNSKGGLHKGLDDLHSYCKQWDLTVNGDKPNVTVFGNMKSRNVSHRYNGE